MAAALYAERLRQADQAAGVKARHHINFRFRQVDSHNEDDKDAPEDIYFDSNPLLLTILIFVLTHTMGLLVSMVAHRPVLGDSMTVVAMITSALPSLTASTLTRVKLSAACCCVWALQASVVSWTHSSVLETEDASPSLLRYWSLRTATGLASILPHALGTTSSGTGRHGWLIAGGVVFSLGLAVASWAAWQASVHARERPHELLSQGLYAYARHPEATSTVVLWLGIWLLNASALVDSLAMAEARERASERRWRLGVKSLDAACCRLHCWIVGYWRLLVALWGPLFVAFILYAQATGRIGSDFATECARFGYGSEPVYTAYIDTVGVFGSWRRFDAKAIRARMQASRPQPSNWVQQWQRRWPKLDMERLHDWQHHWHPDEARRRFLGGRQPKPLFDSDDDNNEEDQNESTHVLLTWEMAQIPTTRAAQRETWQSVKQELQSEKGRPVDQLLKWYHILEESQDADPELEFIVDQVESRFAAMEEEQETTAVTAEEELVESVNHDDHSAHLLVDEADVQTVEEDIRTPPNDGLDDMTDKAEARETTDDFGDLDEMDDSQEVEDLTDNEQSAEAEPYLEDSSTETDMPLPDDTEAPDEQDDETVLSTDNEAVSDLLEVSLDLELEEDEPGPSILFRKVLSFEEFMADLLERTQSQEINSKPFRPKPDSMPDYSSIELPIDANGMNFEKLYFQILAEHELEESRSLLGLGFLFKSLRKALASILDVR